VNKVDRCAPVLSVTVTVYVLVRSLMGVPLVRQPGGDVDMR